MTEEIVYFLSSSGELYHWGVKGMKWGVRRYQNKDGSLTPAGKKRLAEQAGSYMNPGRDSRYKKNREDVAKKYTDELDYFVKKKYNTTLEENPDIIDREWDRMWNKYIDDYSDATLKDFNLKNTESAKKYVKSLFENELLYDYDVYDETGRKITDQYTIDRYGAKDISDYNRWTLKNERLVK